MVHDEIALPRRAILAAAIATGALVASPAAACKSPRPKNQDRYTQAIDQLFSAWWARDFAAFEKPFQHWLPREPFDPRPLFDAHFVKAERRFRGTLLFNGATVIAQVVTPQGPSAVGAVCGGHALAHLFCVKFFPGLDEPVIREIAYVDFDVLAAAEWTSLPGANP